jgi:exonuclease III
MKLITWNCAGRFAKTAGVLFEQDPDIAVIQECLESTVHLVMPVGYKALWFGNDDQKGLAVFCKAHWQIRALAQPSHNWFVPIAVTGAENFTLVAVWSCPPVRGHQAYVKLLREALAANAHWLGHGNVVVAGDFNSNTIFNKPRSRHHTNLVVDLERLGLTSVYHSRHSKNHGAEEQHTFHLQWNCEKRFHIDYLFVPHGWVSCVTDFEICEPSVWAGLRDHLPLIASFASLFSRNELNLATAVSL